MKKEKMAGKPVAAPATQHAALCYRQLGADGAEILLITSRDTGRWVLPKGWPKKGEKGGESALREAREEAGVVGRLSMAAPDFYFYDKAMPGGTALPCCVAVHQVEVAYLEFQFPEMTVRHREWFSPEQAAASVAEPGLQTLLAGFRLPRNEAPTRAKG